MIGEIYEEDVLRLTEIMSLIWNKHRTGKERNNMRNVEAVIFDWAGTTVDYGSCTGAGICGGI